MFTLVTIMNITIRDVNPRFWREMKVQAVKEGVAVGQALNLALENWLTQIKQKPAKKKKSFWELAPYSYEGVDAGKLSTKIDEVLYG